MTAPRSRLIILALVCAVMATALALGLRYEVAAWEPPDAATFRRLVLSGAALVILSGSKSMQIFLEEQVARIKNEANPTEQDKSYLAWIKEEEQAAPNRLYRKLADLERHLDPSYAAANLHLADYRFARLADPLTTPVLRVKDRLTGAVSLHVPGYLTIWGQALPRRCGVLQTLLAPLTPTSQDIADHLYGDYVSFCDVIDDDVDRNVSWCLIILRDKILGILGDHDRVANSRGAFADVLTHMLAEWEEDAARQLRTLSREFALEPDGQAKDGEKLHGEEEIRQLLRSLRPAALMPPEAPFDVARQRIQEMQAERDDPETSDDRKARLDRLIDSYTQWLRSSGR
jgi:hypothetical protein